MCGYVTSFMDFKVSPGFQGDHFHTDSSTEFHAHLLASVQTFPGTIHNEWPGFANY